ncbi:MAG: aromatic ring-hydroxylating dioxygenase subunit alpha [Actinomycetia bacterium]|nr:aromatic ring-hydroxylating dioxygenase subunit alpha [Actinomycetes bacterium]
MTTFLTNIEQLRVRAPPAEAWTLPPRAYTDPAVFDAEVEAIFRRDWICVARAEQVAEPGDQFAVELLDHPLVLTRDRDGTIRALSNVCRHRAMPLVEQSHNGRYLVCPYHLWSYSLDGQLHTAPMMEDVQAFEPHECRLPDIPVEVWEGFVFVSLASAPEPLAPQLEPLRKLVANYRFGELVTAVQIEFDSPWNWKILVENFMEAYHHIGPHRDTFQPTYPARDAFVEDNHGGPWSFLRMPGNHDLDTPDGLPFLGGLERTQRADLFAACVFPTLLFAGSSTLGVWYQLTPHAHNRMTLRIHAMLEAATLADPEVQEALPLLSEGLRHIHTEDIMVNEGPWKGLHSPLAAQGRLSTFEEGIWQLNQVWLDRMHPAD